MEKALVTVSLLPRLYRNEQTDALQKRYFPEGKELFVSCRAQPDSAGTPLFRALQSLREEGCREVFCRMLYMLPGVEYGRAVQELQSLSSMFDALHIGTPLLTSPQDERICCKAVRQAAGALAPEEALLLIGHGTDHVSNACYSRLQQQFCAQGDRAVFVYTLRDLGSEEAFRRLTEAGYRRVVLMPFMISCGHHAQKDVFGEDGSWKSALLAHGFAVRELHTGLEELREIQELFLQHIEF